MSYYENLNLFEEDLARAVFDYYGRDVNEFLNQIGRCVIGFNAGVYAHGDTISNEI